MPTSTVVLDQTQYVRINSGLNPLTLQAHRDHVRIVFNYTQPSISNPTFHILGGDNVEPWFIPAIDTNVWALSLSNESSLIVTEFPSAMMRVDSGRRSAFNDLITVNPTRIVHILPTNGLTNQLTITEFASGVVDTVNGKLRAYTGTDPFAFASVSSDIIPYKCGSGIRIDFTFRFPDAPAEDIQLLAGFITATDGIAFAYTNHDFGAGAGVESVFGILYRHHGDNEIQELKYTVAASGAETVIVQINGSNYNVNLTAGTVQQNAHQTAVSLSAQPALALFKFTAVDDTVLVFGLVARPSGAFSFTPSGTAAASFTQITAGKRPDEEFYPRQEWNIDTRSNLDPTKLQVASIFLQYLGGGGFFFSLEKSTPGIHEPVHIIPHANLNDLPSLADPNMRAGLTAAWLSATPTHSVSVESASISGFIDGDNKRLADPRYFSNTVLNVGTTELNLFTIRNRNVRGTRANRIIVHITKINAQTFGTKGANVRIVRDAILGGTPNFQYVDKELSIIEYDISGTTVSGGTQIGNLDVPAIGASGELNGDLDIHVHPGEQVTFAGGHLSSPAADLRISFEVEEDL